MWIPSFEFWYLFPTGIAVATIAMSSGVSGSNFWIPIYLLVMGLEPRSAFWASLATLCFGFGSGVIQNARAGTIDRPTLTHVLPVAMAAAAIGAVTSRFLPIRWLLVALAAFLIGFAVRLVADVRRHGDAEPTGERPCRVRALLAGLSQGAIATGSGALLLPCLLADRRLGRRPASAVGSTVMVVFACSLVAVVFRLDAALFGALHDDWPSLASMLCFAGPGAAVGGQLGPRLARRLPRRALRLYVAAVLAGVGLLVLTRTIG
ncbi:MAG: sulfite exporter TauE/SafE family protein [Acidobacteriota bacterium]